MVLSPSLFSRSLLETFFTAAALPCMLGGLLSKLCSLFPSERGINFSFIFTQFGKLQFLAVQQH